MAVRVIRSEGFDGVVIDVKTDEGREMALVPYSELGALIEDLKAALLAWAKEREKETGLGAIVAELKEERGRVDRFTWEADDVEWEGQDG